MAQAGLHVVKDAEPTAFGQACYCLEPICFRLDEKGNLYLKPGYTWPHYAGIAACFIDNLAFSGWSKAPITRKGNTITVDVADGNATYIIESLNSDGVYCCILVGSEWAENKLS